MTDTKLTALILTKNEELAIERSVSAVRFCDQVIVVDSASIDKTVALARQQGAEIINFTWNGGYPKKKQWALEIPSIKNDWVLLLDADEIVSDALAKEILRKVSAPTSSVAAYDIKLEYHFAGRALRHGHTVSKRSLLNRTSCFFPEVGDLEAPGTSEIEYHYQPRVNGEVSTLTERLIHEDPDPLSSWIARHNKYSDWEAFLIDNPRARAEVRSSRSSQGRIFERMPAKPLFFFVYCYVVRLGFLDGRAGFDYAFGLAWYYWLTGAKVRERRKGSSLG
jgi:glycosyltransferase involved in cell wall biosynthesis